MTMTMSGLLYIMLGWSLSGPAWGWKLNLGTCRVTVHTHELRHHFHAIRHSVVEQDMYLGAKFFESDIMKDVQDSERCCLLQHLLRFYVEKVFSSYASIHAEHKRTTSLMANAFLSIKKDLLQCHCQCGELTKQKMDAIQASFEKLDRDIATVKAFGELDFLLDWLDSLRSTQV
ncbi:interleukin 19 like [Denticeps clupeoides]|uniref:interleukin 19 like n=1 Tax=Denticeps clupeoides TaxID=299321 RepID=UPI0010A46643|nr:interleukin-20-like [Denticeps clupeoides]